MIKIGDKAIIEKQFTQEEVVSYARSSGDSNPVHFDTAYAKQTVFEKPIVHGLLAAGLFGGLLGSELPGNGTIHLGQEIRFLKPVFVGEKVKACIEVIQIREDKPIITFKCHMEKSDGSVAMEGKAVVMYKGSIFK